MVFFTATLAEQEHDPKVISECWRYFTDTLRKRYPGLRIVRVLQKHPKGHGWHVHALFDRVLPARVLLHLASLAGLGRCNFQLVDQQRRQNVVEYCARYITRDLRKRDKSCKGVRLITVAGNLRCAVAWWIRICDIKIETNAGRLRDSLIACCATFGVVLSRCVDSLTLFSKAPPEALAEWRKLNPGFAY